MKSKYLVIILLSTTLSVLFTRCGSSASALQSTLGGNPQLSGISRMLKTAGGLGKLVDKGPFTFLAPTNNALSAMGAGVLEKLLKPENKDTLSLILKKHILPGKFSEKQVQAGGIRNAAGASLELAGARITESIPTKGGLILVIDKVLP